MKPCVGLMRVISPSSIGKIPKRKGLALELKQNTKQRFWMRCAAGVPTLELKGHHAMGHKAACREHSQANADGAMSDSHGKRLTGVWTYCTTALNFLTFTEYAYPMSSELGILGLRPNVLSFVRTFLINTVVRDTEAGKVIFCSVSENG